MKQEAKINYMALCDAEIKKLKNEEQIPSLVLHSCCAPCSSYCIEYLSRYFRITVFYYNPNIYPDSEYYHRAKEQQEFIRDFPTANPVDFIEGTYDKDRFYHEARGLYDEPERGRRCEKCFRLRLGATADMARERGADYFATTLTISPMKDAALLNRIGREEGERAGVMWLPSDFKKRNGYLRSTEISREYGMYRQDYCGCVFSYNERHGKKTQALNDLTQEDR